jgi:hypothetical protein
MIQKSLEADKICTGTIKELKMTELKMKVPASQFISFLSQISAAS